MIDDFGVLILTHGRADRVRTYVTLRRQGYTGPIYLVIDNEDAQADEYRRLYGDHVVMFDKLAVAEWTDSADQSEDRRSIIYARNVAFHVARQLGLRWFLTLDDDYSIFVWKFDAQLRYRERGVQNLDQLFATVLAYYKSVPALTIALAQNGDFVGGEQSSSASKIHIKRKAMNAFFCSVDRPFQYLGRLNEDVNTYVTLGGRGHLFMTVFHAAIIQAPTQQQAGGSTELYRETGTYVKSFYTVMHAPSCTKIGEIGYLHRRIHHRIRWVNAVPCIVPESCRKVHAGGA